MTKKKLNQIKQYSRKNPRKARMIRLAVKRSLNEYAETFRRLAAI